MDRAKWDHPSSSTIGTREFIVLGGGQPPARGRGLALDRRVDEIPLYADEDRAQVEAGDPYGKWTAPAPLTGSWVES